MSDSVLVAPSLSTVQTEETFEFQSYEKSTRSRSYLGPDVTAENVSELISAYYSVPDLIQFFKEHPQYQKITLQFPDELVLDSSIVVQLMQKELCVSDGEACVVDTVKESCGSGSDCCGGSKGECASKAVQQQAGRKIWILADTSYSSCCVDEVASEHVHGDIVVHFGDACMNAVQKLPVIYSFGRPSLNLAAVKERFESEYSEKDAKVCLMADAPYSIHMHALYHMLKNEGYSNLVFADINRGMLEENNHIVGYSGVDESTYKKHATFGNRIIYSDRTTVDNDDDNDNDNELDMHDYKLFHITIPKDPHLLFLTTQFESVTLYDPETNSVNHGPFPSMMKRYKFMHVARTAGTVGILVNTLSLRNTKETINKLTKLLKENGKKHYMFVVGKPNVAKLANFEPIDVWCILGCGQGGIVLDQYNEFYKPIVTPYELIMALDNEVTWTGQWITDFEKIIQEIEHEEDNNDEVGDGHGIQNEDEDDAPEFNAVTGQYVSTSRPLRRIERLEIETPINEVRSSDSTELVQQFSKTVAIKNTVSTSAAFLQTRQWTGLGSDYQTQELDSELEQDGATMEEGTSGIARGYQFDRQNHA